MLASPFVNALRRFRNATFHYQRDLVNTKWAEFMERREESARWIIELHDAFSSFFLREDTWIGVTPTLPEDLRTKIVGKPFDEVIRIVEEWCRHQVA